MRNSLAFIIVALLPLLVYSGPGWGWNYNSYLLGYIYTPTIGHAVGIDALYEQGYRGCSWERYRGVGFFAASNGKSYEVGMKVNLNPTKFMVHFGPFSSGHKLYPMLSLQGGMYEDREGEDRAEGFFLRPALGFTYVSSIQKVLCFRSSAEFGYSQRTSEFTAEGNGIFWTVKMGIGINFVKHKDIRRFQKLHHLAKPKKW